jgi:predicted transcriptional regulator
MRSKKLEIYYPEDSVVNVFAKPGKYLKDDYARYFLSEMLSLAVDKDFSGNDLRVFLAILANLDYENTLNISQQKLADQLNIDRSAIGKSIKRLISKGYLQVVDTAGRQNIYQFNPHIAFRSRAKNYKDLCRAWDKETLPNTQKSPIDLDDDLDIDLEDKLDDKVSQLSQQFGVPQSLVRQIILSLVNQALEPEAQEIPKLPY